MTTSQVKGLVEAMLDKRAWHSGGPDGLRAATVWAANKGPHHKGRLCSRESRELTSATGHILGSPTASLSGNSGQRLWERSVIHQLPGRQSNASRQRSSVKRSATQCADPCSGETQLIKMFMLL